MRTECQLLNLGFQRLLSIKLSIWHVMNGNGSVKVNLHPFLTSLIYESVCSTSRSGSIDPGKSSRYLLVRGQAPQRI